MTEIKTEGAHCARCGAAMLPDHGHDGPCRLFVAAGDTAKLARGKLAAALSLQDELVEALEPFAGFDDGRAPEHLSITAGSGMARRQLTIGDCRRARSLLTRIKSERDRT